MQKHERLCLEAAQDEARKLSGDLTVSVEFGTSSKPKARMILRLGAAERYRFIPCSPRNRTDTIDHMRQWVRREARELLCRRS